ncbi:alpha-12-mannosidase subfamily protein [Rutstroemia sp. NJR-2017a BBW]|nr:alpha-12-mannosidase subfamily protein [Rutstroemia sp. NJR-2017a BBW]
MELVYNWRVLILGVLAATGTGAEGSLEKRDFDVFQYVDPFIGTINGGHVFPGATLPFGKFSAQFKEYNGN